MTARDSRYRHVEDVVRVDAAGRELVATALRRRPVPTGTFRHTLQQGERLDHLGQQYYGRPHRWWEICDANPGVLSPLHLVGTDPLRQVRLTVPDTADLPWHDVLADLRATPGVDRVDLVDVTAPGVRPAADRRQSVATVWFNERSTNATALAAVVSGRTDALAVTALPGPEGSSVVVPPQAARP